MLAPVLMAVALASWPTPLKSAVEAETAMPNPAFTARVKSEAVQMTVEYDPSRPETLRWLVKYPSGRAINKDEKTALDALKRSKPGRDYTCATRTELIPPEVTLKSETASEYIFAYKPRPTAQTPSATAAALKYTLAEVRVSKTTGKLIGGRSWAPAPFKPAPIAKINSFSESFECGQGGLITHSTFNIDMNALGKATKASREMALSEIHAAR